MWRDFSRLAASGGRDALAFDFPSASPDWREMWESIVSQVAVAPSVDAKEALLDDFAHSAGLRTLGFVNAHALNLCVGNPEFARDLMSMDRLVRDGIGVHALYRLVGNRSGINLNGTDIIPALMERFAGRRIALFGTQLHLVDKIAVTLREQLRAEVITADGFQADGYYVERIARTRPDLVILGMGMPKQERVAHLIKHSLRQDVAVVCGGAILDFLSGNKPRAPRLMRSMGLEWVFRLSLEPKRLFKRYVLGNPLFLLRSALLAGLPKREDGKPRVAPEARGPAPAFGLGGPARTTHGSGIEPATRLPVPARPVQEQRVDAPLAPAPRAPVRELMTEARKEPRRAATTVFSANRPVVARQDLYGREKDLDRLLSWVLDQSGNALIYGPRGYGKTSLVRVFGEIADSRGHVVHYASCSRGIDFDSLMRLYLGEILSGKPGGGGDQIGTLTVQQVAARLASLGDKSLVIIIDEFDRIERDDTRESIVELIKDVSDLTASVRFVLVGVATDATVVLGYHPSIARCITCVPLRRLQDPAIETMFRRKAELDGLTVGDAELRRVVELARGSAYHAQLVGQKLVSEARRSGRTNVTSEDLDRVVEAIVRDAALMDDNVARLVRAARSPERSVELVQLARIALADADDTIVAGTGSDQLRLEAMCRTLAADGVLRPGSGNVGYRFANAFLPQLLLMAKPSAQADRTTAD
jgi:exopolysaccharide biosynthesis WecB/TagA/CpsF family protein